MTKFIKSVRKPKQQMQSFATYIVSSIRNNFLNKSSEQKTNLPKDNDRSQSFKTIFCADNNISTPQHT